MGCWAVGYTQEMGERRGLGRSAGVSPNMKSEDWEQLPWLSFKLGSIEAEYRRQFAHSQVRCTFHVLMSNLTP
jgi:hypothetical protein